jgi:RimJ/RimL family protein N-acetyltransferase
LDFAIDVDGHAVGNISIVLGSDIERFSAEIGYFLGEPYWGRGIMSAVVRLLTEEYVFKHTDIVRLFTAVFDYNYASQRVLGKAGFRRLAVLHRSAYKNGHFIDQVAYERVKDE